VAPKLWTKEEMDFERDLALKVFEFAVTALRDGKNS